MPDQPAALRWLLERLSKLITTATTSLEAQYPDGVQAWQDELARQLARYHAAAMLAGAGAQALSEPQTVALTRDLATQLRFLEKFGVVIQEGAQWERGWNSRAEMYAQSIKTPYWRGATRMLPLPAMPAQGTQCMGNCGCAWEIIPIDEANGDYDAFWRRSKDDSCQTCVQREQDWSPAQIRQGVLQI